MSRFTIAFCLFALSAGGATAQDLVDPPRYSIDTAEDGLSAWRIDNETGKTSYCISNGLDSAPACSPWADQPSDIHAPSVDSGEGDDSAIDPEFGCEVTGTEPAPADYYQSIPSGARSESLKVALHRRISADAKKFRYRDVWAELAKTDADPCNPNNVILIYTGRSQPASSRAGSGAGQSDKWTREHIWPKSHGFKYESRAAYTDLHHLRPADKSVNSSRGHLDFGIGGKPQREAENTYRSSTNWEPRDEVKGDIARMLFYMEVRYLEPQGNMQKLFLVEEQTDSGQPSLGYLCTLYAWHVQDPVSNFERRRNNIIHTQQGNRNPFIDHPEWVASIWSSTCGNVGV